MDWGLSRIGAPLARLGQMVRVGHGRVLLRRGRQPFEAVRRFHSHTRDITDPSGMARALVSAAFRGMEAQQVALLLRSSTQDDLVPVTTEGMDWPGDLSLPASSPFTGWLASQRRAVAVREVRALPQWQALPVAVRGALTAMDGGLLVLLRAGDAATGLLVVGGRVGGVPYTGEEVDALEMACHLAAACMENARVYKLLDEQREELRQAREQAARTASMAAVGEAASTLAQEISNPLQTVLNVAHVMAQDVDERGVSRDDIDAVRAEALRASDALRTLLDLVRVDEPSWSARGLNPLILSVVADIGLGASTSRVASVLQLDASEPQVWCDGEQLRRVFHNLIANALGAMPEGGSLAISTRVAGEQVEVRFADTGAGVSPEHLERVFDPFFTTRGEGRGSGLGLAGSRMAVLHHRGTMRMDSQVGKGTAVTIWLPLYAER